MRHRIPVTFAKKRYIGRLFRLSVCCTSTPPNRRTTQVLNSEKRADGDRRDRSERRRSAKGLFELRARRAKAASDRRQTERRGSEGAGRSWFAFWRKD
jgi:hypothetical protein